MNSKYQIISSLLEDINVRSPNGIIADSSEMEEPIKEIDREQPVIYHYIYGKSPALKKILNTGFLYPINKIATEENTENYAKRAIDKKLKGASPNKTNIENATIYWKYIYDKFERNVLKKEYTNYGLYFTPLDLFPIDNKLNTRIKVPYSMIKKNIDKSEVTIQIGANVKLLKSKKQLVDVINYYRDLGDKKIKQIYDSSSLKFRRLPQVVMFIDKLPIKTKMIEYRS